MRGACALALAAALLLTACAAGARSEPEARATELEAHFFDAGAADAILLRTENSAVLIDAGEKGFGGEILAYLAETGVEALDYLIVTHFDSDHVGGAAKVINSIPVGTVLQSNHSKSSGEYEKYVKALSNAGIEPVTVRDVLTFTLDGVSYAVDPPRRTEYGTDESNNSSLIVSVTNGETRFLFTGDAQTERLAEYLDALAAACDVLKVPHHGRDEPLLDALLDAARPSVAVITSSADEPESEATLDALRRAGCRVLLTREGAVTLRSDGATVTAER